MATITQVKFERLFPLAYEKFANIRLEATAIVGPGESVEEVYRQLAMQIEPIGRRFATEGIHTTEITGLPYGS